MVVWTKANQGELVTSALNKEIRREIQDFSHRQGEVKGWYRAKIEIITALGEWAKTKPELSISLYTEVLKVISLTDMGPTQGPEVRLKAPPA